MAYLSTNVSCKSNYPELILPS